MTSDRRGAIVNVLSSRRHPAGPLSGSKLLSRYGLVGTFGLLILVFAVTQSSFATTSNLYVILESAEIVAVAGLGVTGSLAIGGWDLSISGNIDFTVMVVATVVIRWGQSDVVGILAGLGAGLLVGVVNSVLIVRLRIPDLLATLGTMFLFQGLALVITAGQSVSPGMQVSGGKTAPGKFGPILQGLGNGNIPGGVPISIVVFLVVAVIYVVFLERTRWGRAIYATGGNREAARLAGIHVDRYKVVVYILSALLSSIGGIMLAGQLGYGQVGAGDSYLLECVAAALIAYAVWGLKRPNSIGTVVGALFVAVVLNGLTMFNIPYYTQTATEGLILVLALMLSYSVTDRRRRPIRSLRQDAPVTQDADSPEATGLVGSAAGDGSEIAVQSEQ